MLYPDTEALVMQAMTRAFEGAGFTPKQFHKVYNTDLRTVKVCPSPPLASPNLLDTLSLNRIMGARTEVSFEKFCETYEKFCKQAFYRQHDLRSLAFLKNNLKLSPKIADFYFKFDETEDVEKWHKQNYMRLLALAQTAKISFNGETTIDNANSFIVRVGDRRFGLYSGRPITNNRVDRRAEFRPMIDPRGISYAWKRELYNLKPNTIDAAYAELLVTELPGDMKKGLLEGLSILRHGASEVGFKKFIIENLPFKKLGYADAMRLLGIAKNFEYFDDPYYELHEIIVPALVSGRRFKQMFGRKVRETGPQMRYRAWKRWHERINELEKEVLGAISDK